MPLRPPTKLGPYPEFQNPPVIEVACGLRFEGGEKLLPPHFGRFWERVHEDFPVCQLAPPIIGGDQQEMVPLDLSRVWLINAGDDRLLQIQRDHFYYNWRKKGDGPYPRYRTIIGPFQQYLNQFSAFLAESQLGSVRCRTYELTYINHIFASDELPVERVLPMLQWSEQQHQFLPKPRITNWQARIPWQDERGSLSIKLARARRKADSVEMLVLELSAQGPAEPETHNDLIDWFSAAHDWIVFGFEDLTTAEARKLLWGQHA